MVPCSRIDRVEFLQPLSATVKQNLAARAITRGFTAGSRLWDAGASPVGLFIILSGRVRILGGRGGRHRVFHTEGPGGTIGEVPLFAGGAYPATAIASEDVECLVIDRSALESAIRTHPELGFLLLERMARRVRHLLERLSSQTADSVAARLAVFMLDQPQRSDGRIVLVGTQAQLAEEVGTVREVVVRLLRDLADRGIIERLGRGRYAVLDRVRLQEMAENSARRA